ncbi:MAG: hypothetical protein H6840_02830 [Planctomycetes bacterium]|jgi:hypothetical protein|nr:hypothetical protein [Planctomycetota bacterium]
MTRDEITKMYERQPFEPFRIHLADGRAIDVVHREFIAISPTGRTVTVYQPDGDWNLIDLMLVTDISPLRNGKGRKGGGRKKAS